MTVTTGQIERLVDVGGGHWYCSGRGQALRTAARRGFPAVAASTKTSDMADTTIVKNGWVPTSNSGELGRVPPVSLGQRCLNRVQPGGSTCMFMAVMGSPTLNWLVCNAGSDPVRGKWLAVYSSSASCFNFGLWNPKSAPLPRHQP